MNEGTIPTNDQEIPRINKFTTWNQLLILCEIEAV